MIQKLKNIILSLSLVFAFAAPIALAGPAMAATTDQGQINNCLSQGSNLDLATADCNNKDTTGAGVTLNTRIAQVINVFSIVVGVVAVIMIIVGGFRYVSSGGKQETVSGAKTTIMYALVGLVIVALAQTIVRFVLNRTTS